MTPAYKARVWKVRRRWHARRPVLDGNRYRVERKSFHLWKHAIAWTAEARPRPVDYGTMLAPINDCTQPLGDAINGLFAGFRRIQHMTQSDFKLAR